MQTIKIDGLTCSHCATAVANALSAVPGVTKVEVKLKKLWQKESIAFVEGAAEEAALRLAIEQAGYVPQEFSVL